MEDPKEGRGSFIAFLLVLAAVELLFSQVIYADESDWTWTTSLAVAVGIVVFGGVLRANFESTRRKRK